MAEEDQAERSRQYFMRQGYIAASQPQYFEDGSLDITYQPDVYVQAFACARQLGAKRIIDVGCGRARKLVQANPEFEVIGVDFGPNIAYCRKAYEFGQWFEHDLDSDARLPTPEDLLRDSVVVCSDVVEHLTHPERLLVSLRGLVARGARALLISTPERDLARGLGDPGPPANRAHIREWSIREFDAWLEESEFAHRSTGLTRADDFVSAPATILAVAAGNARDLEACKSILVDFVPPECRPKPYRLLTRARLALRMLITGR